MRSAPSFPNLKGLPLVLDVLRDLAEQVLPLGDQFPLDARPSDELLGVDYR